jgi:hypothetical protein
MNQQPKEKQPALELLSSPKTLTTALFAALTIGTSSVNAQTLNPVDKKPATVEMISPTDTLKGTTEAKLEQNKIVIPMGSIDPAIANYLSKSEKNIIFTGESSLSLEQMDRLKLCLASSQSISPDITFTAQGCNISFPGRRPEQTLNIQFVGNLGGGWGAYFNGLVSNQSTLSPAFGFSQFGGDWGGFIEYDPTTGKIFVRIVGGF